MSEPLMDPTSTDIPSLGGQDSVQAMHQRHMSAMNNPAIVGVDPLPGGEGDAGSDRPTSSILMREKAEPKDGFEPVPFLVYVVYGCLLLWGGYYFGTTSGPMTDSFTVLGLEVPWFASNVHDRDDLAPEGRAVVAEPNPRTLDDYKSVGAQVYMTVCQACHQPTGLGNPAQGIPPLAGSEWVAGAEASPARLSRIVLYGLSGKITVAGKEFNGQMPAQGSALKDYQIAAALTFVRNSFGNKGDEKEPAITAAVVKAARAKEPGRATNGSATMTEAALKAIAVTESDMAPPEKKDGPAPEKK